MGPNLEVDLAREKFLWHAKPKIDVADKVVFKKFDVSNSSPKLKLLLQFMIVKYFTIAGKFTIGKV